MDKKESIKEYGSDLLKQYRELEKKHTTLRNKVVKRFRFILKNSDHPYLYGFMDHEVIGYSIEMMIFVIMRVEASYVAKTVQTDLFNNENK